MVVRRSEPVRLDDTVALITGASAGIGQSVAIRFAAHGARVLVHGRDPDRTEAVARSVNGTALVADLATPQGRRDLIMEAERQFGRIDVLVNNAGIGWSGPFTQMTVDEIRRVVEVDLLAAVELTHAVLPGMLDRSRGAVCFVSSVAGRTGVAGEAVYSATKAGLDAFAESLRFEAAGTGVHVGVVVPGVVNTGFFEKRGRPNERARPKPVPPEAVADSVLSAVAGRAEVWIPRWLRVASTIRAVTPSAYRRLATRFGEPIRLGRP
jgi:short-subunit dehydrogenase